MIIRHDEPNVRTGRVDQVPGAATILAPPESICAGINDLGILRIEGEEGDGTTQIEQPPGLAAILRNISARHVTSHEHQVRIVGTDGWIKLRAPATRPQDSPRVEPRRGIAMAILGSGNCVVRSKKDNECEAKNHKLQK